MHALNKGLFMHAVFLEIGPFTLHLYGVLMAAGFMAGLYNWVLLGRSRGRDAQSCADLMFWVMVSGILGARVAYVLEHWADYAADPLTILRLDQGGLIFYGGFVAAGAALVIYARRRREPLIPLLDFVLTAVPLSHAFGRVGCFLNGCCFGRCTSLPVGVQFPRGSGPWMEHYGSKLIDEYARVSLSVHPVQLYEAIYNLLIYGLLVFTFRRSPRAGTISALYLILYALGRFVLEFVRGDRGDRLAVSGLSIGQFVSIPLFIVGIILLGGLLLKRTSSNSARG
jgi:phosphatidylglycerol:prolipoprotein diacylglycerol transferase